MTRSSTSRMPQAGFEPARGWFLRPLPLPLGYCGRPRGQRLAHSSCSGQDSNLHQRDSRSRASAGWATGAPLHFSEWTPEGVEPSSAGCKPAVLPLDDGPICFSVLREGVEPSTSAFGGPRSDPIELPQRLLGTTASTPSRSPGRIRTCNRPVLSRPPLPNWATGPIHLPRTPSLHRAGLEPASDRLKAGGSAVELSVRRRRRALRHAPRFMRTGRDSNPQPTP